MVKSNSYKLVWDRKALDQFKEILAFLQKQSKQAPKIVRDTIFSKLDLIKTNPFICESDKLKDPPDPDFRAFVVFHYRVTYQINTESREIRILRIRHASREPIGY